jgi:selenium metabolism protein YedF
MTGKEPYLLMIKSCYVGDSEPDLGDTLMKSFLNMVWESGSLPSKVVCLASGVFLTTEGSPVAELLRKFVDSGVEVASCGTCLDYYKRRESLIIGRQTNMKEIVSWLQGFERVIYS